MANSVLISSLDFGARQLYIVTSERFLQNCYVWIIARPPLGTKAGHLTAYMNVEKAQWMKIDDDIARLKWDVTFEGISSLELTIPIDLTRHIPVMVYDYWVGRDWMGQQPQPEWDEVLASMQTLFDSYLESIGAEPANA